MMLGSANLQTSADAVLNNSGIPGLPPCTSIEMLSVWVLDWNADRFVNLGTYLPAP